MDLKIGALLIGVQISTLLPLRPCACPLDYSPVCGSNTITYSNECRLLCARIETGEKIQKLQDRACSICSCDLIFSPICGSDGVTHDNQCNFDCAKLDNPKLTMRYKRQCILELY